MPTKEVVLNSSQIEIDLVFQEQIQSVRVVFVSLEYISRLE